VFCRYLLCSCSCSLLLPPIIFASFCILLLSWLYFLLYWNHWSDLWLCLVVGTDDVQVLELPIVDGLHPRPPFMPQAVPADLAPRIMRLHGHPFVWWVSQFVSYLFRLQPPLVTAIEQLQQQLGFRHPIVGSVGWQMTKSLANRNLCTVSKKVEMCKWKLQGAYRSWKVMELGLDPGVSWKVVENKPNGCRISDHFIHVFDLYIHYCRPLSDSIQSVV